MIFFKNSLFVVLSNFLFSFSQWIIVITLTKFGNIYEVGLYSFALALFGPFAMFFNFGLRTLYVTQSTKTLQFSTALSIRNFTNIMLFICTFVIILVYRTFSVLDIIILIVIFLVKLIQTQQDMYFAYYQKIEDLVTYSFRKLIRTSISIITFLLFYYISKNILLSFVLLLIIEIYYLYKEHKIIFKKQNKGKILELERKDLINIIKMGLPLAIAHSLSSLGTNFPKLFLEKQGSLELLGYYSSLMFFYSSGVVLFLAISNLLMPKFHNSLKNRERIFKIFVLSFGAYFLICSIIVLAVYNIGGEILTLVYNEEFYKYKYELLIIMCGSSLIYFSTIFDSFLSAINKYKVQMYSQYISLIILIYFSIYLIKKYSITGAVFSFLIYSATVFLLKLLYTIYFYKKVII